jgi:serine/threonine protein phosphatase PrpC
VAQPAEVDAVAQPAGSGEVAQPAEVDAVAQPAGAGSGAAGSAGCPSCAAPVGGADRFCEACGYDLVRGLARPAAPAAPAPVRPRRLTSVGAPDACAGCAGDRFGPEGYCDNCGQRRPAGRDHNELDLDLIAAVTDLGHRHRHNEDAVALGLLPGVGVAVVCDGVSSSTRPDTASHAAVDAAIDALLEALAGGRDPEPALAAATGAAQAAAALAAGAEPGANPPSCTFVAAVVTADSVSVGWVGDSRAYWLPDRDGHPAVLTTDDSVSGQLAAAGVPVAAQPASPNPSALVRWLGADALDTAPHLITIRPTGPGRLLVCSDGLFRYRPAPAELAAATPPGAPIDVARHLVQLALDAGGQDNVTVAVLPYPAPSTPEERPA